MFKVINNGLSIDWLFAFIVNNNDARTSIDITVVSLLLTLSIFRTIFRHISTYICLPAKGFGFFIVDLQQVFALCDFLFKVLHAIIEALKIKNKVPVLDSRNCFGH